jgi:hypothetical protein
MLYFAMLERWVIEILWAGGLKKLEVFDAALVMS